MSSMEISKAYTFDDILLVPQKSNVKPSDCQTATYLSKKIKLEVPIISAAMDTSWPLGTSQSGYWAGPFR